MMPTYIPFTPAEAIAYACTFIGAVLIAYVVIIGTERGAK